MSTDFEREIGSSMMPIENPSDIVENSKWIEEYRKRLAILLPEMTEAKKDFLEYAAKIFEVSQEELYTKAKKYLEESYLKDDNSYIERQEARIERYSKSADYLKQAEEITDALLSKKISTYEAVDTDFAEIVSLMLDIKQTKASQQERKDTYLKKIEERDIMFAIKEMVIEQNPAYENEVESRLQAWEEQWGNINKLNNEAQSHGIPKKLLDIDNSYMGEVYIGFVKSVESGYLIDMNNGKYKITKSLRAFLEFLGANNIPYSLQILRDRLLKFSGDPYKEGTLKKELQRHPSNT